MSFAPKRDQNLSAEVFLMKKLFVLSLFLLTTFGLAEAQVSGGMGRSGGQVPSPNSQVPGTAQQPGMPGSSDPTGQQSTAPAQGQASSAPITEGCLGGSAPNFTITDKAGTTYKLNVPQGTDTSSLTPHVGESVQVQGDVSSGKTSSINVQRIGRGTGTCSGSTQKQ
jgi:hypothetical protein